MPVLESCSEARATSAGQIFRLGAQAIAQSKHTLLLTSFYHRIKSRKGPLTAIKATARKIAVIFYNVMTKGIEFAEEGIKQYEQKIKERQMKYLQKNKLNALECFLHLNLNEFIHWLGFYLKQHINIT